MSFRSRLLLFFGVIVVVPMVAVAVVLFQITEDSETGKADARLAAGSRTALSVYRLARDRAGGALDRVTDDRTLQRAIASGDGAAVRRRVAELERADPSIQSIAVYGPAERVMGAAGLPAAVAPATAVATRAGGRRLGTIAVSVTLAPSYAAEVSRLTGFEIRVVRKASVLASTVRGRGSATSRSGELVIDDREYRAAFQQVRELVGPPVSIGVLEDAGELSERVTESRLFIGGILGAFLLVAVLFSMFLVRALQGQIDQFLKAARSLARGDFSRRVPTQGGDEFAALGAEFNSMSEQLAANIAEIERKRDELEETIRRVGEAFAAGLDRQGLVDLAVRTAVEACSAEAGRVVPIDIRKVPQSYVGVDELRLRSALEAAERQAFKIGTDDVPMLLPDLDDHHHLVEGRRPSRAVVSGVHALAVPLRAGFGPEPYAEDVGVVSIARAGSDFTPAESDLFTYLAGQAAVSIENANLHETVQRQALTDELTGLFNVRHFHEALDGEIERCRRFDGSVGLVMMDIDDFKQVNDTYGHPQGDLVLLEVARVLKELSRDIDEPARYGGEEMAIILPQTDLSGAELLAERVRATIEQLGIRRLGPDGALRVTASFGVSSLPESAVDKESLIAAADAALYRAKRAGKNRVERADPAPAPR